MPRDGSITFGDLVDQLDDRLGRYSLKRLILARGRDGKLAEWIEEMTRGCPHRISPGLANACGARCPELTASFGGQGGGEPPGAA
jgi:hypothetical protein